MHKHLLPLFFLINLLYACSSAPSANKQGHHSALDSLMQAYWDERMQLFPVEATATGDNRYNDQLPVTISSSYRERCRSFYTKYLQALQQNRDTLRDEDRLNRELLGYELQLNLDALEFPSHLIPVNQFWSFTLEFPQLGSGTGNQPFHTTHDYDQFLSRMHRFPAWVDTAIQNMREGIQTQWVLPKALIRKIIPQLRGVLASETEKSIFYEPVKHFPEAVNPADRTRLQQAYIKAINEDIQPAYSKLATFMEQEYLPAGRTSDGISALPQGRNYYDFLIRYYTTTQMKSDTIYQIGLREVNRLETEMYHVKEQVGFTGSLQDFFQYLNTDKNFFPFRTAQAILDSFRAIHKTEEPLLKTIFHMQPKTAFEIRQTEAYRAASASAEYNPGSEDGSRPGIFYVPILNPAEFNAVGMETLFLHEAIPGHHYQISLQQENHDLPMFRKFLSYSAYCEGWALYSETLGRPLGLFQNPYQYFGHLSDAMHRAIRLVVDVAIHTGQMTREQAITYMRNHERISAQEAESEIERYMAIPGQALSYKIGQLTLIRLRERYEAKMGSAFQLAAFHEQVLNGGNMPLDILEKKLDRWAARP